VTDYIELKRKTLGSIKWTAITEIITKSVQPLLFIILARILTPYEFGLVGTAIIVISFLRVFIDAGLGKALVQTKYDIQIACNIVFFTNIALGLIVYLLLFFSANKVAAFFDSPEGVNIIRVLGLQLIFVSFSSVQEFRFIRDFNFKKLLWSKLTITILPAIISIIFAIIGYGVWALVYGYLFGSISNMIILWWLSDWRPSYEFNNKIMKRLFKFGLWVFLDGLGIWVISWGDQILVGKYLSIRELGVYRVGVSLTALIYGVALNPFLAVLYPLFSKTQNNSIETEGYFNKINKIILLVSIPLAATLMICGNDIINIIFINETEKWEGLGFVFAMLGMQAGIAWVIAINGELYRAIGRPDLNTKFMYAQMAIYAPVYFFSIKYGIASFLYGKLFVVLITTVFHVWLIVKVQKVSPFYLWYQGKSVIISTAIMSLIVLSTKYIFQLVNLEMSIFASSVLFIFESIISFTIVFWVLNKDYALSIYKLIAVILKKKQLYNGNNT
jgi:O-antigen/teichoic acid export membrane protein